MNFFDKITGNDMTREMKIYYNRLEKLPDDYQEAWKKIEEFIWMHADFTGRKILPIFDNLLDFFEEAVTNGQSVKDVLDDDIKSFCEALMGGDDLKTYHNKLRRKLNKSIAKKLEK